MNMWGELTVENHEENLHANKVINLKDFKWNSWKNFFEVFHG